MHVKTSVSLPEELLANIDRRAPQFGSRSALVAVAVRTLLDAIERQERDEQDRAILDRLADRLNVEAEDALTYQANG